MAEFKAGDVVQLKSSGPFMTVSEVEGSQVHCVWFGNRDGEPLFKTFSAASLKLAPQK